MFSVRRLIPFDPGHPPGTLAGCRARPAGIALPSRRSRSASLTSVLHDHVQVDARPSRLRRSADEPGFTPIDVGHNQRPVRYCTSRLRSLGLWVSGISAYMMTAASALSQPSSVSHL